MIITSDSTSALASKGESIRNYYNPGGASRLIFVSMASTSANEDYIVSQSGDSEVHIVNMPVRSSLFFIVSLGYRLFCDRQVARVWNSVSPLLDRDHRIVVWGFNPFLEGFIAVNLASRIKNAKSMISVHGVWDFDELTGLRRIRSLLRRHIEKKTVNGADATVSVYKDAVEYCKRLGRYNQNYLAYNRTRKFDIKWEQPDDLSLLWVNRVTEFKNPINIIAAAIKTNVKLTIFGVGNRLDFCKRYCVKFDKNGVVNFISSIPNAELDSYFAKSVYVLNMNLLGIPKGLIEAATVGCPVIWGVNSRNHTLETQLPGPFFCNDSVAAFEASINFFKNREAREYYSEKMIKWQKDLLNDPENKSWDYVIKKLVNAD